MFSKPNNFTLLSKYIILCKAQGNVLRAIYKIRNQREQHSVFMTLSTKSFLGFDNNGFKDVLPVKCPMQQVICNSAWSLLAASVTCDFEAGLIKASHEQFPEGGHPNGCSFHFKKCNKEQLVKLGVHELLRDKLLRKGGLLDILMVIPHSDIETKGKPKFYLYLRFLSYNVLTSLYDTLGIDYIRHVLMGVMNSWSEFEKTKTGEAVMLEAYFVYFMRVWMGIFGPEYWSIYGRRGIDVNDDYTLINRTNNPLERYNRTLGEHFVHAHPTLPMLIQVLREKAERYVELLQNIEMGMTKPTPHEPLYIPEIPEEYYCWRSTK